MAAFRSLWDSHEACVKNDVPEYGKAERVRYRLRRELAEEIQARLCDDISELAGMRIATRARYLGVEIGASVAAEHRTALVEKRLPRAARVP